MYGELCSSCGRKKFDHKDQTDLFATTIAHAAAFEGIRRIAERARRGKDSFENPFLLIEQLAAMHAWLLGDCMGDRIIEEFPDDERPDLIENRWKFRGIDRLVEAVKEEAIAEMRMKFPDRPSVRPRAPRGPRIDPESEDKTDGNEDEETDEL